MEDTNVIYRFIKHVKRYEGKLCTEKCFVGGECKGAMQSRKERNCVNLVKEDENSKYDSGSKFTPKK